MDKKIATRTPARQELPKDARIAQHVKSTATWTDLALPADVVIKLMEFCHQVQHNGRRAKQGNGKKVLFSGPNGSCKTKAAEAVANELGLNLYRIDLAAVINKHIGETEKNLSRIFDSAENKGWILFFDEADALFGKRTEIKDTHDKYADQEVAHLLQCMEAHNGLVIIASNACPEMTDTIDDGFLRRLRYIVEFPASQTKENPQSIAHKILPRTDRRVRDKMQSIRISDNLVLQLHPDPSVLEQSTSWTDAEAHDPGITTIELLCYSITDLGYRCSDPQLPPAEQKQSLVKLHAKVRELDDILSRLTAKPSKK